uniref:Uncharacterized protein n=1 Tax=Arundo donax TaxID=35708 RepID=A0A0A9H0E6_ARUDO
MGVRPLRAGMVSQPSETYSKLRRPHLSV